MRLFVAVWPSPGVARRLKELRRPAVDGVRWTTPDQWHVTLRFLGRVADCARAREAFLGSGPAPASPVRAAAGPATAWLGRGVLQLPVDGLVSLAEHMRVGTDGLAQDSAPKGPYKGHLTLARAKGRLRRSELPWLAGEEFSATWWVREVTLVASTLGSEGSRYDVIESLPLTSPERG